jgi:hypothetical protein
MDFKSGLREKPELIKVYEKISRGIWSYKGFFELIDAAIVSDRKRKVFKFSLNPVEKKSFGRVIDLQSIDSHSSKGGSLATRSRSVCALQLNEEPALRSRHSVFKRRQQFDRANVRLLCAKCNLAKSDKIITILPWLYTASAAVAQLHKIS